MRTLIIGDMHTDSSILDRADSVKDIDRIILLGDYMDDWHAGFGDRINMAEKLRDYVLDKQRHGIRVDVLLGNHDIAYLLGKESRFFTHVYYMSPGFDSYSENGVHHIYSHIPFSIMTTVRHHGNTWLCSHAGITESWLNHVMPSVHDEDTISDTVNHMNDWRTLFMCGSGRGGHDGYSSPLWADRYELTEDHPNGMNQIVGHTPTKSVSMISDGTSRLMFADTFSRTSDGVHIGDSSVIVMDDDDEKDHGYGDGIQTICI